VVEGRGGTRPSTSCIEMEGGGNQLSGTHSIPVEVVYAKWNSAQGGTHFLSSTSTVLVMTQSGRRCRCGAVTCYVIQFLPRKTWEGGKNILDLGG